MPRPGVHVRVLQPAASRRNIRSRPPRSRLRPRERPAPRGAAPPWFRAPAPPAAAARFPSDGAARFASYIRSILGRKPQDHVSHPFPEQRGVGSLLVIPPDFLQIGDLPPEEPLQQPGFDRGRTLQELT